MNEKIQQLILILENLKGSWNYAEPLLLVVQSGNITEEKTDALISLFSHSLKALKNRELERKSLFFLEVINESKQREIQEHQKELKQEENILARIL